MEATILEEGKSVLISEMSIIIQTCKPSSHSMILLPSLTPLQILPERKKPFPTYYIASRRCFKSNNLIYLGVCPIRSYLDRGNTLKQKKVHRRFTQYGLIVFRTFPGFFSTVTGFTHACRAEEWK